LEINKLMKLTRASFDEQRTAYCILLEGGVLVTGEDDAPLLGNPDDAFNSCVPSVHRFVLLSVNTKKKMNSGQ
jgi:hypothetical protein